MAVRRTNAVPRTSPALSALLGLSGLCARARQGGVLSEALAIVLEGTGAARGAIYEVGVDGLELVVEEGLSPTMRAFIRAFPANEPPWFPVQTAAKKRRVVLEEDVAEACASHIDRALVHASGWSSIAAAPIMIGRDVLGVLAIAAASPDAFSPDAATVLETAANTLALAIAREKSQPDGKAAMPSHDRKGAADTKLARLAILGSLAAGFADELRWPLSSLGTQLEEQEKLIGHLRVRYPGVAAAFDDLARIQDEATTALRFARTAGSRLLSAIEESNAEPIDLADLAHEAAALVEPTARAKNVDLLVTSLHEVEPIVVGKRSEIGQLLLSLLTNGVEACASMVKAPAKLGVEPEKPLVCVSVSREQNKIHVSVEDSGPGIAPDIRPRIFDPFYTTKKDSLGIGLTLARQVAVAHGGTIELDRSELGGALVRAILPAAPAGTALPKHSAPASRRKPLRSSPPGEATPHTARDGWTGAPRHLTSSGLAIPRPVRAPTAAPNPLIVAPDTDVCAPTQRVPQTPPAGVPVVRAAISISRAPLATPAAASEPAATPKPEMDQPAPRYTPNGGNVVPTARVPEAPRRPPRSRRTQ
jgi:signal transduction histidine kinase